MSYYIYKHLDNDNNIIYIGQTVDMKSRQYTHKFSSEWKKEISKIEYAEVTDNLLMDIYERYYISKYTPKFNIKGIDCKYDEFFAMMKELEFKEYKTLNYEKNSKPINKRFIKSFDDYYNKVYKMITEFKLEFNRSGKIIGDTFCINKDLNCMIYFKGSNVVFSNNLFHHSVGDSYYYKINAYNLNLNQYNNLKSPEQLTYKSLDELWSEIFLDISTPNII